MAFPVAGPVASQASTPRAVESGGAVARMRPKWRRAAIRLGQTPIAAAQGVTHTNARRAAGEGLGLALGGILGTLVDIM
ncbi:hypothetical protein GCM10023081_29190 [Arthrobacter ginkgonis]|uniref:Uncharacterized protein n=1 Tax=Arthrobacter ginkgonis TaxID=1630594 RepID=A0ABP7CJQ2_9MICC